MPFSSKLTVFYHARVIEPMDASCVANTQQAHAPQPGEDMKIYLLMLIIGTLLTAIHFTSAPQKRTETLPQ
ncbi:MAG: hypothetical protein ABWY14_13910 [Tardiphaga sp.]